MPHRDKGPASKIAASTAALPLTSAGTRSTADNNAATTKHMRSWHHLTQTKSRHLNDIRNMCKFQATAPQQHCLRHTTSACSSTADGGRGQRRVLMHQVLHHHHHLHRAVQLVLYSPCSQLTTSTRWRTQWPPPPCRQPPPGAAGHPQHALRLDLAPETVLKLFLSYAR